MNLFAKLSLLLLLFLAVMLQLPTLIGLTFQSSSQVMRVPSHYNSIQKAIESIDLGGEILVDALQGPYRESIVIERSGISLRSINGTATIISESEDRPVITIAGAAEIRIDGFVLQGGSIGIVLTNTDGALIKSNQISKNLQGVGLIQSKNNTLSLNTISENGSIGVLIQKSSLNQILHNEIRDNPIGGLFFEQNASGNLIETNVIRGSDMAVRLMTSSSNSFVGNIIDQNGTYGISIETSVETLLTNNSITANATGIQIVNGTGSYLCGNQIDMNQTGLEILGSSRRILIQENAFNSNLSFALINRSTERIDATLNYWGSYDGPDSSASVELAIIAKRISGDVAFDPWLKEPVNCQND